MRPLRDTINRTILMAGMVFFLAPSPLSANREQLWSGLGTSRGDWSLISENDQYAEFVFNKDTGSGSIVLDYAEDPLDISEFIYAAVDVDNLSAGQLDVAIALLSNPSQEWSNKTDGRFIVEAGESELLRVFMLRKAMDSQSAWVKEFGNLYAFPGGYQRHWRHLDTTAIKRVQMNFKWTDSGEGPVQIRISKPRGESQYLTNEETLASLPHPLLDEHGQLIPNDWPGRIADDNELADDAKQDLSNYTAKQLASEQGLSKYGGWLNGPKLEATGYFRTEKIDGKWWLVDPDGNLFWSVGVTEAGIGSLTRIEGREHVFPKLRAPSDSEVWVKERGTLSYNFYHSNLKEKYGDDWLEKHHAVTEGRMRDWGVNTIGAWSVEPGSVFKWKRPSVPYTVIVHTDLRGGLGKLHEMIDPFSKQFDESLNAGLSRAAKDYNGDPNNIGIFVNNELNWVGGIQLPLEVLKLKSYRPAKKAMLQQLEDKYGTIDVLNEAWGTAFKSFKDIRADKQLTANAAFQQDMKAYLKLFAETFFSKCAEAVEQHFPDHLYLGCRFNVYTPIVTRAASKYCDVLSFNLYRNSIASFKAQTNRDVPYLISEFHFGSGSHGVWGRGLTPCADADNQADLYRAYVSDALQHPAFVGAHWFTWADQPVTGRYDGENFRVGLVSITDRPHEDLVESVRSISEKMYEARSGKPVETVTLAN